MGAWGYGLFQSDNDFDQIGDLGGEAGLYDLEEQAVKEAEAQGKEVKVPATKDNEIDINYSIYAPLCSDPEKIRKHLDNGVLEYLFAKTTGNWGGYLTQPGYTFVLVGACAMSLGCKLRTDIRRRLINKFDRSGLMPEAENQICAALIGPNAYKSGEPYEFDSPGLVETANADTNRTPNAFGVIGLNVPAPGGFFAAPKRTTKLPPKPTDAELESMFPGELCAGCGAKEGEEGGALLACGKCKTRKYCGKECQKQHWKLHKALCEGPEGNKENIMQ